jgi:hypothetical protein
MKKIWGVLTFAAGAGALLGVSERAVAQTGFNGTITFAMHTENGKNMTMIQTTSGNKVRMQMVDSAKGPNQAAGVILDGDAQTMTIMMPEQQKYMTVTQDQMKQSAAMMAGRTSANPSSTTATPWTVTNTGRSETVAGVSCQVYHVSGISQAGKPGEGDVCVAQGVGFAMMDPSYRNMMTMGRVNTAPEFAQVSDLLKGGKGILKVTEIKDGKSTIMLVATNIDRSSPSSSAFAPPTGYTQFQMPQMPAGMKMPAGGMGVPGAKPPG